NKAAKRAIFATADQGRNRAGLAEQHAGYVLTREIRDQTVFTADTKRRKLPGYSVERDLSERVGNGSEPTRHRCQSFLQFRRQLAAYQAFIAATEHTLRAEKRVGNARQTERVGHATFTGNTEGGDRGT